MPETPKPRVSVLFSHMPKNGSYIVSDLPPGFVELECPKCGRRGRYKRETLVEKFGADAPLPDVRVALADCPKANDYADMCGVRYVGMPWMKE